MKYIVNVREIWIQIIEVEAENKDEAIKLVKLGEGERIEDKYLRTLNSNLWTVDETE